MALKSIFRAVAAQGIVHGGGGLQCGNWHRSYQAAEKDLDSMVDNLVYSDNWSGIEVMRVDESKAWQVLHEQGR